MVSMEINVLLPITSFIFHELPVMEIMLKNYSIHHLYFLENLSNPKVQTGTIIVCPNYYKRLTI